MEEMANLSMYITQDCLVVPIQVDINDESILDIQAQILKRIHGKIIKGVIIDVSGVVIIDSFIARKIFNTAEMVSLLGAKMVITGLRPEVVISLIDLDFEQGDVLTAINLEEGFRILEPFVRSKVGEIQGR